MPPIRANTVLPEHGEPVATLVTLHPLPTAGGSMDSHLLRKMAWRLPALAGLAVLRFDTRGTGASEGSFDGGQAETFDVAAAVDWVAASGLPRVWLVGWSFGTDLALRHGLLPGVEGAILISPPLRTATDDDLDSWARDGRPLVAVVPEFDDYLRPAAAADRFARVPGARVVAVPVARHLFVGHAEEALDEVVRPVLPDRVPLARDWPPE
jgi:alpha/beta superfamily hydrolase